MSLARLDDSEAEIVRALALSPFQSGPMIDYAVRYALLPEHPDRFETALKLVQIVLKTEPGNRSAQLAKILLLFHMKRITDAEPILADLNKRDAKSADVQLVAAVYFDLKGNPGAADERMQLARKLEPNLFELNLVPKPLELLYRVARKAHYRGGFYFSPDTLYPLKTVASAAP